MVRGLRSTSDPSARRSSRFTSYHFVHKGADFIYLGNADWQDGPAGGVHGEEVHFFVDP
jgi:hypothetical protein